MRRKKIKSLSSSNSKVRKRRLKLSLNRLLKKRFLVVLGILICIIGGLLILKFGIFKIRKVEVLGVSNCGNPSEIVSVSGILGKMFFGIDEKKAKDKLQARFLCLKDVRVQKSILGSTKIQVINRAPTLIVKNLPKKELVFLNELEASPSSDTAKLFELNYSVAESSNEFLLVDQEGFIYDIPADNMGLPVIYIQGEELKQGSKLSFELVQSVSFVLSKLPELGVTVQASKVVGDNFLVDSQPKLVFSLTRDIRLQIASLQLILTKSTINPDSLNLESEENQEPPILESVDLRFEKAVVVYSP